MSTPGTHDLKLESRLNIKDLESVKDAFMKAGTGYDGKLCVDRDTFCVLMQRMLSQGSYDEYEDLFDKIDVTKEGLVDWDKLASHLLLQYSEKDDRVKSTQVPQWKDIRVLPSTHKDIIQKVAYLKNTSRYIAISKEGGISTWDGQLHLQKSIKQVNNESVKPRDMWVTTFVVLQNLNKIALSFTSKEIVFYDLSSKLEFNTQYRVFGLESTPLSMDYWGNPQNPNEAILVMGDTAGNVNAFVFSSTSIALFDRPSQSNNDGQDQIVNVNFKHLIKDKFKYCRLVRHQDHKEWARQVKYAQHLDCFISCSTTTRNAMVLGWIEKARQKMKTSSFNIAQGVNAFDYHDTLNLIATAGVSNHVCLWNPYVVSKPVGLLRGHMAPVMHVQFNYSRGQLISFSKDKVLRIWDVQLQVCLQRMAGMFPKGPELTTSMFFHEERSRVFMTFNYQFTLLEMQPEVKDRIMSHDKPVTCAIYSPRCNQVFSACQNSVVNVWMLDTGQKVKQFLDCHGNSEVTAMALDLNETRLFTGSSDGTVKVWDFNGHCHHTLHAGMGKPADISQIVVLKRGLVVIGWDRHITIFHNSQLNQFHVQPADWKGRQEHHDDILAATFSQPHTLATASYDGEIVIWNTGSESASRHLKERCYKKAKTKEKHKGNTSQSTNHGRVSQSPRKATDTNLSPRRQQPSVSRMSQIRKDSAIRRAGSKLTGTIGSPANGSEDALNRALSRASVSSEDEQIDFIVTRLTFLDVAKDQSTSEGANLVACGGNGWVRFWNYNQNKLMAEFVAHTNVAVIVMAVSTDGSYLVTGDTEGLVKVWNIKQYCQQPMEGGGQIITTPPPMLATWQPHNDVIESLVLCERNERPLVISASMDCSVQVWDVYGNHIGTFGQEEHWRIDSYQPPTNIPDDDQISIQSDESSEVSPSPRGVTLDIQDTIEVAIETDQIDDDKEQDPLSKVNTWERTRLGKQYQEQRMKKRERKQPGTIPDLPYLNWEKTGQAPSGPFAHQPPPPPQTTTEKPILPLWTQALAVPELDTVGTLQKPDFVINPHRYFADREDVIVVKSQSGDSIDGDHGVKQQFDERSLFPKYILEYESRMRAQHRAELGEVDETGGRATRLKAPKSRFRSWGTVASTGNAISGLRKSSAAPVQNKPPARLSPLPEGKKPHLNLKPIAQEMG